MGSNCGNSNGHQGVLAHGLLPETEPIKDMQATANNIGSKYTRTYLKHS